MIIQRRDYSLFLLLLAFLLILPACQKKIPPPSSDRLATNTTGAMEKPYVLLISLDGFRWDYVERFKPPNLNRFIEEGAKAESLIPCFPSKTFTNHYSIATGMYPDKHGLVGNSFYSPALDDTYQISKRVAVEDGRYYGGSPIWVEATKAGMVTASFFFVGTEAKIQGVRPTYYYQYDGSIPNRDRVKQIVDWLKLPADERPHWLGLYFSDMDDRGHRISPDNDEILKETLLKLDADLGVLFDEIQKLDLPINILIVSDHGMRTMTPYNYIPFEKVANDELYQAINNGAIINIHPNQGHSVDSIYQYLKEKENHFKVYQTTDAPYFEYTPTHPNWGPIQVIPDSGFYFLSARIIGLKKIAGSSLSGDHGFDPMLQDMHGIFYANGPAIQKGAVIPPLKNIHIYPLMCAILDIPIPEDIDGRLAAIEQVLLSNPE